MPWKQILLKAIVTFRLFTLTARYGNVPYWVSRPSRSRTICKIALPEKVWRHHFIYASYYFSQIASGGKVWNKTIFQSFSCLFLWSFRKRCHFSRILLHHMQRYLLRRIAAGGENEENFVRWMTHGVMSKVVIWQQWCHWK